MLNLLKKSENIESILGRILQISTFFVGLLYVAGFVVVNLFLSNFGSISFELFKVKYVIVGLIAIIFLLINILPSSISFYFALTERIKNYQELLLKLTYLIVGIFIVNMLVMLIFSSTEFNIIKDETINRSSNSEFVVFKIIKNYFLKTNLLAVFISSVLLYLIRFKFKTNLLNETIRFILCFIMSLFFITSSSHFQDFLQNPTLTIFNSNDDGILTWFYAFSLAFHSSISVSMFFFSLEYLGFNPREILDNMPKNEAINNSLVIFCLVGFLFTIISIFPYVNNLYPLMPQNLGGGKPILIDIKFQDDKTFSDFKNKSTYLLDRSNTFLYIVKEDDGKLQRYEVPISEIKLLEYK